MAARQINVLQLNCHKHKETNVEVNNWIGHNARSIALLQEPALANAKGKINCINTKRIKCHVGGNNKPRACILLDRRIKSFIQTEFCDRDTVTVKITDIGTNEGIFICSAYMPFDSTDLPPPRMVQQLIEHCDRNNIDLILGMDANAHHIIWGSSDTNARGENLLEYIASTNLIICNRGNSPTFSVANRQEVLDLTLCSMNIQTKVHDWKVSNEEMLSDHRPITFTLNFEPHSEPEGFQCIKKTHWGIFNSELEKQIQFFANSEDLDSKVEQLNIAIKLAYDKSCPVIYKKGNNTDLPWWNNDLEKMKKTRARLKRRYHNERNEENRVLLNEAKATYRKAMNKARREQWENYCENMEKIGVVARIHKVMKNGKMAEIGTLRKDNGEYTSNETETLEELFTKLLPTLQNNDNSGMDIGNIPNLGLTDEIIDKIVNPTTLEAALAAFDPYKSPGFDGIYPVMLQKSLVTLGAYIIEIFKLSLKTGKLAKQWLKVKTVFIPKPGKTDYTIAKSFRPISLMSFMLKTLERLIYWHLQNEHLHRIPLNEKIYSYREGVSTETALHEVTQKIEKAFVKKHMVLAVYLDISGAFSNTATHSLTNALVRRGVEKEIIGWTNHFLTCRTATANIGLVTMDREVNNGCPEGGILSPPLFNCVASEAVDLFNEVPGTDCYGYADDIKLMVVGNDIMDMGRQMQAAINKLMTWACLNNLKFNPDKTKAMLYTRKHKVVGRPILNIDGKTIEYVDTFKYLGVHFDTKLNWTFHLEKLIKMAQASLMTARNLVGRYWGLTPKVTKWIYTALVRPMITYGSIVWVTALRKSNICKKFNSLQRMACKMITSAIHSTPTAGMEILLGLLPLAEHIKLTATSTSVRMTRSGHWKVTAEDNPVNSHTGYLEAIRQEVPETYFPQDKSAFKERITAKFLTKIGDREDLKKNKIRPMPTDRNVVNCFTDGSKTETGTGAAYLIKGYQLKHQDFINLGCSITVFQAEITAISMAAQHMVDKSVMDRTINFYIDSQSAIKALRSYLVYTKSVCECKRFLNKLSEKNMVCLNWIPGHEGQLGNEIADRLAKRGADLLTEGFEPRMAISPCVAKAALENWFISRQNTSWKNRTDCRQTRLALPDTDHKWKKCVKYLDRNGMRIITQIATGHASLKRHKFLMGLENSPDCDMCGMEQTPIHIFTECPFLVGQRVMVFNRPTLEVNMLSKFSFSRIIKFAYLTELWKDVGGQ